MLHRPTNPVSRRLARLAFYLACLAALTVAACGPVHHYLGLDLDLTFTAYRYGFYLAAAAMALALGTLVPTRPGDHRRGFVAAILALLVGLGAAWGPGEWLLAARASPRINDVSTDTADVPAMVVTQQMRRGAPNPAAYPGNGAAAQQRAAYPDIGPILLNMSPADAFRRVDEVAMSMGWEVVARAPAEGRYEAVDTSEWFGLQDDIVVRLRPEGTTGTRIDIRSKSRVGESDFGTNAQRIRTFREKLKTGR